MYFFDLITRSLLGWFGIGGAGLITPSAFVVPSTKSTTVLAVGATAVTTAALTQGSVMLLPSVDIWLVRGGTAATVPTTLAAGGIRIMAGNAVRVVMPGVGETLSIIAQAVGTVEITPQV
jgi:hypothetical protein